MNWFSRMFGRYSAWMQQMEEDMVRDVMLIQISAYISQNGVLVVKDERPE